MSASRVEGLTSSRGYLHGGWHLRGGKKHAEKDFIWWMGGLSAKNGKKNRESLREEGGLQKKRGGGFDEWL